ncbi:MAG TPA: hypothetical protein VGO47_14425 [Chlamydiales bacterium]|nr:hypothetical protein [Chlamydiales bacterium]
MLPSLNNFITFGKDVFQNRPDYRAMAVDIYTTAMTNEHLGDNDRTNGCKVAESLLLNLPGHLDDVCLFCCYLGFLLTLVGSTQKLSTIVATALKFLSPQHRRRYFHLNNHNVLINCIYYNPSMASQILESHGATNQFFEEWFKIINSSEGMPRVHCKKLTIVALCKVLETLPVAAPPAVQGAWVHVMVGLLKNLRDLPKALEGETLCVHSRL